MTVTNRNRVRKFKLFLFGGLALVAAIACLYFAFRTIRYDREWNEALAAEPANFPVDLATTGTTSGVFHHTYHMGHGVAFYLVPTEESQDTLNELKRIKGSLKLLNTHETVIDSRRQFDPLTEMQLLNEPQGLRIAYFFSGLGLKGKYRVEIETESSSNYFKAHSVRLISKYHLCGCEKVVQLISGAISMISGLAALLFALGAWTQLRNLPVD